MNLELVHKVLLRKANEASYTNLEIEEINYSCESLIIEFFLRREILRELSKVVIKEDEVEEVYQLNKEKLLMEEYVKIDTIFLTEEEKAESILKEVNTKNFEKYKKKYDEKNGVEEDKLDEKIPLSRLHPLIIEAIKMIPKKGISKKVVKIDDGYHIVYLKSKEDVRIATYQEARDLLIEEMNKNLYYKIYNELIQKFIEEDSKIDLENSKKILKNDKVSIE